jgi:predicted  nucleic acid-binding Zn-ribbon protein
VGGLFSGLWGLLNQPLEILITEYVRKRLGVKDNSDRLANIDKQILALAIKLDKACREIAKLGTDIAVLAVGEETELEQINALKSQLGNLERELLDLRRSLTQIYELLGGKIEDLYYRLNERNN